MVGAVKLQRFWAKVTVKIADTRIAYNQDATVPLSRKLKCQSVDQKLKSECTKKSSFKALKEVQKCCFQFSTVLDVTKLMVMIENVPSDHSPKVLK